MSQQKSSQDKILYQIKSLGPQTAKALSRQLGMTTMGARQHLALLEDQDLVKQTDTEKQKRGRPVRRWQLTEQAQKRFPDIHAQIVTDLIASVLEVFGQKGLDRLINKRATSLEKVYEEVLQTCATLEEKVVALSKIRSQAGYMSEYTLAKDGSLLLLENHCPINVAAQACQGFCRTELEIFQNLLADEAQIERTDHIMSGERRCAYKITPKP
jgi:predicted ArsR family transcriptional regulator|tara:strand:- start:149 stop:787 length:639 start_codon:yes stop_codon:yes gene_type:complete